MQRQNLLTLTLTMTVDADDIDRLPGFPGGFGCPPESGLERWLGSNDEWLVDTVQEIVPWTIRYCNVVVECQRLPDKEEDL